MNSLIINWVIIIIIGFGLSRFMNSKQAFYSGLISIIIGTVITYGVHALWISTNNLIWALIAVGHASFWSGMFSSINKR